VIGPISTDQLLSRRDRLTISVAVVTGSKRRKNGFEIIAVTLNRRAHSHAQDLINQGQFVLDERDMWSEHQPSARQENRYIEEHGFGEYARWYLGIDTAEDEDNKGRYKFPYGDFERVHRCGVLTAESRAGQCKYDDIEGPAAHLHGVLDAVRQTQR
jgi:hypothetical protein